MNVRRERAPGSALADPGASEEAREDWCARPNAYRHCTRRTAAKQCERCSKDQPIISARCLNIKFNTSSERGRSGRRRRGSRMP